MDLYVERQCVEQLRKGDYEKFFVLFDEYFPSLYKYVARRIADIDEIGRIVRLTFLDALGQIQSMPNDIAYLVWLYGLAKPRIWSFIDKNGFQVRRGLVSGNGFVDEEDDDDERAEKMFGKLSLEEGEILKLKFFEELSDGDVLFIFGGEESVIGPKIYRVLKRAHFFLFGESDTPKSAYFGDLSSFLARLKEKENLIVPEAFRLSLRAEMQNRVDRKETAIEVEAVEDVPVINPADMPKGSNDPAKIFVEAVKEMREDAAAEQAKRQEKIEKRERIFAFFERWRLLFALIPVLVFIVVAGYVGVIIFGKSGSYERPPRIVSGCQIDIDFKDEYAFTEFVLLNAQITDPLCQHFDPRKMLVMKDNSGAVNVAVDLEKEILDYEFVDRDGNWRIHKYEKTIDSN